MHPCVGAHGQGRGLECDIGRVQVRTWVRTWVWMYGTKDGKPDFSEGFCVPIAAMAAPRVDLLGLFGRR